MPETYQTANEAPNDYDYDDDDDDDQGLELCDICLESKYRENKCESIQKCFKMSGLKIRKNLYIFFSL